MVWFILDNDGNILSVWSTEQGAIESAECYSCDTSIKFMYLDYIA